jgi:tetratricopeptide (TPR) repeat protein
MRLAVTTAVALAALAGAGCATGGRARSDPTGRRLDLVPVSRAMTDVDQLAARGGEEIRDERRRLTMAAARTPQDPVARFLAVWAQPHGEDRWGGFKQLAREFPESALGQIGMASVYVEWKILDQADAAVGRALAVEPDSWLAVLFRAAVAERRAQWELAARDHRAVLAADTMNPEAHLGLARCARARGDAAGARQEAEAALAEAPDHLGALALLAEVADEAGDRAEATARWAQVVEASPRDRNARLRLARCHRAAGRPDLARDQLRAAVALKEDAESLGLLADAARAADDPRAELEAAERLAALNPSAAEWRRLAEMRLAAGDVEGSERAIRRALAGDARDPAANALLGRIRLRRGDPQEAVEALRVGGEPARAELSALERRLNVEKLSRPDVDELQRAVQSAVDRTYRARAAEVPSLAGDLKVRVTVSPAGEATLVEVLEDTLHDADVRACAYWNLRDAAYPQSRPGRFTFDFSFARR